jgi:hypothetical protein
MQTLGFPSSTIKLHGQPELNPKHRGDNPASHRVTNPDNTPKNKDR